MKRTPLFNQHNAQNAILMNFADWEMPLHYGSQLVEHNHVRTVAGMFDVSHMGIIDVKGPASKKFLSMMLANDINTLHEPGRALYSCMLQENGGIIDDLIAYYIGENYYRLVVNASCTEKDFKWLNRHAKEYNLELVLRKDLAMIAVQGPLAIDNAASALGAVLSKSIRSLERFGCIEIGTWFIARTGYTGEDGIEIILPAIQAEECWQNLLKHGVQPVGLGARDTLRLEAGYNLYGHDMDESVSPLEANLAWSVAFEPESRHFIGRKALHEQLKVGVQKKLISVALQDKGVLRAGQKIFSNDKEVGVVTSGTFSPLLHLAIGFARVATPVNSDYFVEIRNKKFPLIVVKGPFVKHGKPNIGIKSEGKA
jgi:aminomethyltransferase